MKVSIIGAGNVGASCAEYIAISKIANEVVLLDIKEGLSEGKALDLTQTASTLGFDTVIKGVTNDYKSTKDSDVVVITSGIPRKPGMTREELIDINAGIVNTVTESILKFSPKAIIVVVSNPMDTMTYLALKSNRLDKKRLLEWVERLTVLGLKLTYPKHSTNHNLIFMLWLLVVTVTLL